MNFVKMQMFRVEIFKPTSKNEGFSIRLYYFMFFLPQSFGSGQLILMILFLLKAGAFASIILVNKLF